MKAVDVESCVITAGRRPVEVNGGDESTADSQLSQTYKKITNTSVNGTQIETHPICSDKFKLNGDVSVYLNGNDSLNDESQSGISKEYKHNLKSFHSVDGEQKSPEVDILCNGKITDEQCEKLPPAVHIRRKLHSVTDMFELKSGDDYVMIGMPNGKLTSYESDNLCSENVYRRLLADKSQNGNLTEEETNATVISDKSSNEGDKQTICQRFNGFSENEIGENSNLGCGPEITLTDSARVTMPDIICTGDNETNCKIKKNTAANGIAANGEMLPVNGCSEDSIQDEVDRGCQDSPTTDWDRAVSEVKEQAIARLQEELHKAHQELKLRDEEVNRLSRIRQEVEGELEELTASLFQEAHNMVRAANVKQAAAERSLKESQMQVDVLMAEVAALKTLVLTSTPSRPNPHLHPQIDPRAGRSKDDASPTAGVSLFNKKHRRSPSHFNLKYGRENSPPESPVKEQQTPVPDLYDNKDGWEVDPIVHKEFVAWKNNPKVHKSDPFIARIYNEDINLCLEFQNTELGSKVREAVEEGIIFIEAVSDKSKTMFPKKCALLETSRQCHYRMKLGDQEQWHYISQICRNRIIAVCDFLNYLRYIERGLVKSSVHDIYWEMTRLRKEMILARLGLPLSS